MNRTFSIIQQRTDGRFIVFDTSDGEVKISTDWEYVGENFQVRVLAAEKPNSIYGLFGEPFFL